MTSRFAFFIGVAICYFVQASLSRGANVGVLMSHVSLSSRSGEGIAASADRALGDMTVAVGIATVGRKAVLRDMLIELQAQTRAPDHVFICCVSEEDVDRAALSALRFPVTVVVSPRGLPKQRNRALDVASGCDVLVFFDDDFIPAPDFLARLVEDFVRLPDVVAMTGRVLVDGILGPGLTMPEGLEALRNPSPPPPGQPILQSVHNAYGCNMAFRLAPIVAHGLRFDEQLPLYGWLEDVDFCRQLAPYGRIVKNNALTGAHLGVKGGRTSGLRLGYSQIANPIYLARKGTLRLDRALRQIGRNVLANAFHVFRPEPWCDRNGRVRGNLHAVTDLLFRRLHPQRIFELD